LTIVFDPHIILALKLNPAISINNITIIPPASNGKNPVAKRIRVIGINKAMLIGRGIFIVIAIKNNTKSNITLVIIGVPKTLAV